MAVRRRRFLRCRCSNLSLFLRVKILRLAHRKFTFPLFRRFKHGKVKYQLVFLCLLSTLTDNSGSIKALSFPVTFTTDLGNNNKNVQRIEMDNEYSTRSNFLQSLTVENFMKTRLHKMVVIRMESRQRERNQRKLRLSTRNESNRL